MNSNFLLTNYGKGKVAFIELKNGKSVIGTIKDVDRYMNISLSSVNVVSSSENGEVKEIIGKELLIKKAAIIYIALSSEITAAVRKDYCLPLEQNQANDEEILFSSEPVENNPIFINKSYNSNFSSTSLSSNNNSYKGRNNYNNKNNNNRYNQRADNSNNKIVNDTHKNNEISNINNNKNNSSNDNYNRGRKEGYNNNNNNNYRNNNKSQRTNSYSNNSKSQTTEKKPIQDKEKSIQLIINKPVTDDNEVNEFVTKNE